MGTKITQEDNIGRIEQLDAKWEAQERRLETIEHIALIVFAVGLTLLILFLISEMIK